jgi:hypothetical protein
VGNGEYEIRLGGEMSSIDVVALNRARTTFQRVSDAKFFNGWVKHITLDSVVAHTCTSMQMQLGEEFSFQVYGNRKDAFFHAILTTLHRADEGPVFSLDRLGGATPVELGCQLATEMTLKDSSGQPRFCVEGACADIKSESGHQVENAIIIDIGPAGFAAITDRKLRKGDRVTVSLFARGQMVRCQAEVRNCVVNTVNADFQRTGLLITRMERVDALRWKQIYVAILDENKMHGSMRTAEIGKVVKLISKHAA